ncbi:MAG: hypothetical protein QGH20_06380, partial [Candidatus Latescibacteria bacterium]|nr:hypothetical protein [Candidatus Latescibacterota bacterium]
SPAILSHESLPCMDDSEFQAVFQLNHRLILPKSSCRCKLWLRENPLPIPYCHRLLESTRVNIPLLVTRQRWR